MGYDIPAHLESETGEVARSEHVSRDRAIELILTAGIRTLRNSARNAEHFGSVTGSGAHRSKEAVDRYLTDLRSEW
jgi:hypothetical protein